MDVRRRGHVKLRMGSSGVTCPAGGAFARSRDASGKIRTTGVQDRRDWTSPSFLSSAEMPQLLGLVKIVVGAGLFPQT